MCPYIDKQSINPHDIHSIWQSEANDDKDFNYTDVTFLCTYKYT